MFTVTHSEHNPILSPLKEHSWEAAAAFNGCPIIVGTETHMVYRAMSDPDILKEPHIRMSVIGHAVSTDGIHFNQRKPLIVPSTDFDRFGCEDPRITKLDDTYYICYTGLGGYPFSADNIKVAVALSTDLKTITEKHLVTPFNAKAMAIFPERINGKMAGLVTVNTDRKPSDICYVEFEKKEDMWSPDFWHEWYTHLDLHKINIRRKEDDQVELGAQPVKTDKGWLIIYSHIQRYGKSDQAFGVEALLLDLANPRRIIGRTEGPFMVPESYYDHIGQVPHVIFPTGALIRGNTLEIHYGAADTHCAYATIPLDNLLTVLTSKKGTYGFKRFTRNPIISPRAGYMWEQEGTINPAAIDLGNKTHILYRAVARGNRSTIGYASTSDGFTLDQRSDKPIYFPRASFEINANRDDNFGCEDPRLAEIHGRIYMSYTAYDGITPRVAVSSLSTADFLAQKWSSWSAPEVITPLNVPNKDSIIIPEPIDGRYMVIHRVQQIICADFLDSLDFSKEKIDSCIELLAPRPGMWDGIKVGISTPAIKTDKGWLILYHGISWSHIYRVGAILLDLDDPTIVKARTAMPIFEPEEPYECNGTVSNVVFPCGFVVRGNTGYMYYGAGDSVSGVATIDMPTLFKILEV